jgi:inosose dehydratase
MDIRLASAPVCWGVLLKDTPGVPPYGQVLDEIKAAGYTGTELGPYGYLPLEPDKLRAELDERGLTLLSAYTQIYFADPDAYPDFFEETLTTARLLSEMGCEWIVLSDVLLVDKNRASRAGRIRPEDGLSQSQWDTFAKNVQDFARRARDEFGLKSVFHNHVGAFVETPDEIDALLSRTDPSLVGLCLDTAHAMYGGGDPVAILTKWSERVWYLHLKECDQPTLKAVTESEGDYFAGVDAGVFPELGQGSVDFAAFHALLTGMDFDGWAIIEQDILPGTGADPLASARRNREYLEALGW